MSQNLPNCSLRNFLFYVILTIFYLLARTTETSSLPNDSMRPLFKQFEIFSGILTVYFNRENTHELLECHLGISTSGRKPFGSNNKTAGKQVWLYFIGRTTRRRYGGTTTTLYIVLNTPKKSLLKSSHQKIPEWKISNPKKSFEHPPHFKSVVPSLGSQLIAMGFSFHNTMLFPLISKR